jgi:hypothetical protein
MPNISQRKGMYCGYAKFFAMNKIPSHKNDCLPYVEYERIKTK